jgi:predicted ArsR family transcriptional regulator
MAEQSPTPKEQILKLLAEYRYLTVKQLWEKTGAAWAGKSPTQMRVELNRLKKAGLVTNHTTEPHKGGAADKHWMLLRPEALQGSEHFSQLLEV